MDDDGARAVRAGSPAAPETGRRGEDLRQLSVDELTERYVQAFAESRHKELERGISLVGPHRDELELILGQAPPRDTPPTVKPGPCACPCGWPPTT